MKNTDELRILADEPRLQSLFLLLFRHDGYFTSMQLAEELGVTSRTIKSDVLLLKQIFYTEEVFITSKPSKGYQLEVMNKETENKIKQFFFKFILQYQVKVNLIIVFVILFVDCYLRKKLSKKKIYRRKSRLAIL